MQAHIVIVQHATSHNVGATLTHVFPPRDLFQSVCKSILICIQFLHLHISSQCRISKPAAFTKVSMYRRETFMNSCDTLLAAGNFHSGNYRSQNYPNYQSR